MKGIRLFILGKRLKDIYPHATMWQVIKYRTARFFRRLVILAGLLLAVTAVFNLGSQLNPTIKEVEAIKEVEVKTITPILKRIANCESPKGHYENGQVLLRANKNGSVDIGKYQINTLWAKKATELGLNLMNEQENEQFAVWLYENRGTEDWVWSKPCWQK